MAHCHGNTAQLRMITLFDGGEKSVHVNMYYLSFAIYINVFNWFVHHLAVILSFFATPISPHTKLQNTPSIPFVSIV
jgi:hypothetical protein